MHPVFEMFVRAYLFLSFMFVLQDRLILQFSYLLKELKEKVKSNFGNSDGYESSRSSEMKTSKKTKNKKNFTKTKNKCQI